MNLLILFAAGADLEAPRRTLSPTGKDVPTGTLSPHWIGLYRTCGNPRSTLLVLGSGQRLVTTFERV